MTIYIVFFFAFLLRLINLNQSLWLDETIVAKVVQSIPFHLIPFQFSPADFHPPLYYLFISAWSTLFGTSEIALRLPSVIASLVTGAFVYKIGLYLKDKQSALWATVFFLFNPLIIYYSQEARMYMMATMFLTAALYHILRLMKSHEKKDLILFNAFSALSMLTFYGCAFFIAGMVAVEVYQSFIINKSKKPFISSFLHLFIGTFISLLLLSPLLYQQVANARISLVNVKNWSMVLGKAEFKNIALIFLKFATGRISWFPKWSYYLIAGIPTALIGIMAILGAKKNKVLGFIFILPLLFGLFISFWAPMMMYFRFLYLIPVMSIFLAWGVHNRKNNGMRIMALCLFAIFSLTYLLLPQFHREDWKSLVENLSTNTRVYMIIPSSDPLAYYRKDIPVHELRDIRTKPLPEFITIVPYTSEIYGFNYQQILQDRGCIKSSQMQFRGNLQLEEWTCLTKS